MATTSDSAKATWAVASLPSSVTYVLSANVFACAIAVVTTVIRCSSMGPPRGGPPVRPAARRATDVPPETRARRGSLSGRSLNQLRHLEHSAHSSAISPRHCGGAKLGQLGHRGPSHLPPC